VDDFKVTYGTASGEKIVKFVDDLPLGVLLPGKK
jgi:hypothetical protein